MVSLTLCDKTLNIGFISTRIAGTDGVSLETIKWADVFEKEGFTCFYFAGELETPPDRSYFVEEAHFQHPDIKDIYQNSFGLQVRRRSTTEKIHNFRCRLKDYLYRFIKKFNINFLVLENTLAIPLNIPLGLAITEVISETGMPAIAHHHDFSWERDRLKISAVNDYLKMAFPPDLPSVKHVVISSSANTRLSFRTGISATVIPNVMDFENPPPLSTDDYASDMREALGIENDELLILQPTRVVMRKRIEHSIELVQKLKMKAKLVISHASGDEGYDYERKIKEYSKLMKVDTVFVSDIIHERRGYTKTGKKIYALSDIYSYADLVTYPSIIEGFGNAFLEAIYFRRPVVVNTYSIYTMDIKPKGFDTVELNGYVTEGAVSKTREILKDPELRNRMVARNYEIARHYYSYSVLSHKLKNIILDCTNHRKKEFKAL